MRRRSHRAKSRGTVGLSLAQMRGMRRHVWCIREDHITVRRMWFCTYCDTCSSGAEFEKADKKEWSEKNGFVLPTHSEYVKCGVCCAAAKAPSAVVKKRKTNAATLVL